MRHAGVTQRAQSGIVLRSRSLLAALVAAGASTLPAAVRAESGGIVPSAFFVAKSENRNQVHYGVRVDAGCRPAGDAPVFAYWRMLERGAQATEPLLSREVPAYGLADQRVLERRADGGRALVRLQALGTRTIEVDTSARDGVCIATATTTIAGQPATLANVYVQLRWPFGVDHLELAGRALSDGHVVRERLSP